MAGYWANSFFPFRAVIKRQGLEISPGCYEQVRIHTGFHRFMEIGQGKGTGFYPV